MCQYVDRDEVQQAGWMQYCLRGGRPQQTNDALAHFSLSEPLHFDVHAARNSSN